jgi:hypothetical protein
MVAMPDGTELVNQAPSPSPEPESEEEDEDPDEYDTMAFTLGRNLGGPTPFGAFGRLSRNRVVLPQVSLRPLRYSTRWENQVGTYNFARLYYGYYSRAFTWNVHYHSPPCDMAHISGHTVLPYPDHPGRPMWVPVQDHNVFYSYRCNCPLCRRRSRRLPQDPKHSRHLWAFTLPARFHLTMTENPDPREFLLRVADWVFGHSSDVRRGNVHPNASNEQRTNWLLRPIDEGDYVLYKHWFYYNTPADPLFDGRPTLYVPVGALQLEN